MKRWTLSSLPPIKASVLLFPKPSPQWNYFRKFVCVGQREYMCKLCPSSVSL